jgi:hypothetical protein
MLTNFQAAGMASTQAEVFRRFTRSVFDAQAALLSPRDRRGTAPTRVTAAASAWS